MLPAIRSAFAAHGVVEVRLTREWRDERKLAADAIAEGFTTIISVGGDGTAGNVANAILHSGADIRLGVIPAGTGDDFAKALGTGGKSLEIVARKSVESAERRVDAGCVEDNFFVNSCGFGFDVAVLRGMSETGWLRGNAVYVYTALRQLLRFRGLHIAIESSAGKRERDLYMMLVIANAPWFGGAFLIAPSALVTDGELDAVLVHDASAPRRMRMLAAAIRGRHPVYPEVRLERAAEFTVGFDDVPFYEADGEVHEAKSATLTVRCVPGALRVITGDDGLRLPKTPGIPPNDSRVNFAVHPTR
jgi:diacylglycerol kinase (ATP)